MAIVRFDPKARSIQINAVVRDGDVLGLEMALDTGSTTSTIPLWVAQFLNLPEAGEAAITTPTDTVSVREFVAGRFRALEQSVKGLEVLAVDLPLAAGVDGLLGLNFLRNFKLFINFPKGKLTLLSGNSNVFRRLAGFIELARVYW